MPIPGMSGLELSTRLRDVLPPPRILLYTGSSNEISDRVWPRAVCTNPWTSRWTMQIAPAQ